MIHTVLPRYNGLQALQIRRGVLRLDEEQLELHPEVVQTPLPTPVAPDRLAVTAELGPEEQISIDGRSIEIKVDASRNNADATSCLWHPDTARDWRTTSVVFLLR